MGRGLRRRYGRSTGPGKKVVPLTDLPASVTAVLRSLPRNMPQNIHLNVTTSAFRHYPSEEALFDLASGQVLPAPVKMPDGWRGDEDYFVPANQLPLREGVGYIANTGTGYAVLQLVRADFDRLTAGQPALPDVSKEECQALDAIISTIPKGRPGYFKVLGLGPYGKTNPYIVSLVSKKLLTKGGTATALGQSVHVALHAYDQPSRPLI